MSMMTIEELAAKYNKSVELINRGNFKKAMQLLKECLAQRRFKEGLTNIGNCYRHFGDDKNMFKAYKEAIDPKTPFLDPQQLGFENDYPHALNNLGLAYFMYGKDYDAITCYERAIAVDSKMWDAWWNKSTAILRQACSGYTELFKPGWDAYDARFLKNPPIKLKNTKETLVYWDGKSKVDSLIVLAEQGIGDNIMWGRYLQWLNRYATRVSVQCDPSLECIFKDFNPVRDASETDATVAIPMCNLSKVFCPDIPAGDWLRGKFGSMEFPSETFNIGIVWAGSAGHANNAYRSVPVHRFHRLAKYANLYSLSPDFKGNKFVKPLALSSWDDTAAAINGLDLIISVDTSVVHMAGSLGAETWMLQPLKETDFRWGNGVSKSPWYSSVEIFENPQDWEFVFNMVEERLREKLYC